MINGSEGLKEKPIKKRKNSDPNWRADKQAKRGKPSTQGLLNLMGVGTSPDPLFTMVRQNNSPLKRISSSKTLIFSSPLRGVLTTSATTPTGQNQLVPTRIIECDDVTIGFFHSVKKCPNIEWQIPAVPPATLDQSPVPAASMAGIIDFELTAAMLDHIPARTSQSQVTKCAASDAVALGGIQVQPGDAQWLHLMFHLGASTQTVANLVLGTKHCNAAMELMNPELKAVIKREKLKSLFVSIVPEFVPGYEKIRLAKRIKMTIKDQPGKSCTRSISVSFNALSLTPVCSSEIEPMKEIITKKFAGIGKENNQAMVKKLKL